MFTQLSDVLETLVIWFGDNTKTYVPFTEIKSSKFYPYYTGIQAQIDINKYIKGMDCRSVQFSFKNSKKYSIEMELDDANWDTVRPLFKRRRTQKGIKIVLEKTENNTRKTYYTTIRQIVHDEDDTTINCKNYPNIEFDSYEDCDMVFTRQTYQTQYYENNCGKGKIISTGKIVPIFTTNNFDEVTKDMDANCSTFFGFPLATGLETSSCPMPCTTTFSDTLQTFIDYGHDMREIVLAFDKSVLVRRIKVDTFQMMQSLNYLGSELGLWPGLGIFQLIQWLLKNISWRTLIEKCIKRGPQQTVN